MYLKFIKEASLHPNVLIYLFVYSLFQKPNINYRFIHIFEILYSLSYFSALLELLFDTPVYCR